jgi:hypothetical protein
VYTVFLETYLQPLLFPALHLNRRSLCEFSQQHFGRDVTRLRHHSDGVKL